MQNFPSGRDGLLRAADFIRTGRDDRELRRAADRGELTAIAPGVYLPTSVWSTTGDCDRHSLRAAAFRPRLGDRAAFSHVTAGALHGWRLLDPFPALVEVTDADIVRTRRGATARLHAVSLAAPDIVVAASMPTTSPGRTAVDLVASQAFAAATVSLDSALRAGLAHKRFRRGKRAEQHGSPLMLGDFDSALERRLPVRAHRHVQRVREFADGRSGSPGESLSRVSMHERGWPAPTLQEPFFENSPEKLEVDFWWAEHGIIGEFDGFVKYSRGEYLRGRTPAQAAVDEKRREDRLRAHPAVRGFARWMWDDLMHPHRLDAILAAAGLRPIAG